MKHTVVVGCGRPPCSFRQCCSVVHHSVSINRFSTCLPRSARFYFSIGAGGARRAPAPRRPAPRRPGAPPPPRGAAGRGGCPAFPDSDSTHEYTKKHAILNMKKDKGCSTRGNVTGGDGPARDMRSWAHLAPRRLTHRVSHTHAHASDSRSNPLPLQFAASSWAHFRDGARGV